MNTVVNKSFLQFVRLGIGTDNNAIIPKEVEWEQLKALADEQGLLAIVIDGIERVPDNERPPKVLLLNWIGEVLQYENKSAIQQKAAYELARLFHTNYIRTYVLKGEVVSECYPKPVHRICSDLDCFLVPEKSDFDAWSLGNDLIRAKGFEVETVFYKNSTFFLPGLMVENHQFLTPFRGNKKLEALERVLQALIHEDKNNNKFHDTWLYRPPVMATALFLIEHAYSHFLHEGLTWRHILDWRMFADKHKSSICWSTLDVLIDEYGFRRFYDSYNRLGQYLIGITSFEELNKKDRIMLEDVWAPLDLHDSVRGWKGKLALAGNTWRARWKYRYFTEISWVTALWIQVKGFLFEKNPKLN